MEAINFGPWNSLLEEEFEKPYFKDLMNRVASAYEKGDPHIFPAQSDIFNAFLMTPPETVKVVILGQDPYHGPGQANGLAFSVNKGVKLPPSLSNIFLELVHDTGCSYPEHGNLSAWAEQGVLLLNTCLTVEEGKPNSHAALGWQFLTKAVFHAVLNLPQPVVFLLWGKHAQGFVADTDIQKYQNKKVLMTTHPSPLSARKSAKTLPAFLGSRPFSQANDLLIRMGDTPIFWGLRT